MSVPFAAPSVGLDWTTVDDHCLQQVNTAYSERRQADNPVLVGEVDALAPGHDWQDVSYWSGMQTYIDAACERYVDHTAGDDFTGLAALPAFTLDSFRAAAGLHADGWRRKRHPADPWSYGPAQAGDLVAGPWLIEDLQAALSAMRWTCRTFRHPPLRPDNLYARQAWADWDAVLTDPVFNALRSPDEGEDYRHPHRLIGKRHMERKEQGYFATDIQNYPCGHPGYLLWDHDRITETYLYWDVTPSPINLYLSWPGAEAVWNDLGDFPDVSGDWASFSRVQTVSEAGDTTLYQFPTALAFNPPADDPPDWQYHGWSVRLASCKFVFKWDFTNANV